MLQHDPNMYQEKYYQKSIEAPDLEEVNFENGYSISFAPTREDIELTDPNGHTVVRILMTSEGPVVQIQAAQMQFKASNKISLESKEIELNARENLKLSSNGNFQQTVENDATSEARIQNIKARLGNVNIKANDDVRLDGERIKLNCSE